MSKRDVFSPFRVAFNGIVHTFRTQRHMRIHLYVTFATLLGAMFFQLRLREILILLFMITFVLVAEMFNSAIEATVDLASPQFHPLAKFAKDIAAGAVLITTIMAIVVGSLIALGDGQWERIRVSLSGEGIGLPVAVRIGIGLFFNSRRRCYRKRIREPRSSTPRGARLWACRHRIFLGSQRPIHFRKCPCRRHRRHHGNNHCSKPVRGQVPLCV
ncbi:diacylglycerol kinase family protein [Geitlerinema splendidum]|nr:diacylglycerol kinase family protein [Geitlerinema splendidum]